MSNEQFRDSMNNATSQIIESLVANMTKAWFVVEREAKIKCPVDQGPLRASIFSQVALDGNKVVGRVGASEEYAPYVHQGTGLYAVNGDGRKEPWGYEVLAGKYKGFHKTHGQKPQPFLQNAVDQERDIITSIIAGVENA